MNGRPTGSRKADSENRNLGGGTKLCPDYADAALERAQGEFQAKQEPGDILGEPAELFGNIREFAQIRNDLPWISGLRNKYAWYEVAGSDVGPG
jgi:hypothetical protein